MSPTRADLLINVVRRTAPKPNADCTTGLRCALTRQFTDTMRTRERTSTTCTIQCAFEGLRECSIGKNHEGARAVFKNKTNKKKKLQKGAVHQKSKEQKAKTMVVESNKPNTAFRER